MTLAVRPIAGGVVLEFTTANKQEVADLQLLLRETAAIVEYHSKLAAVRLRAANLKREEDALPAVDITVKPTATGASVTIRPEESQDGLAVLARARTFKQFWDTHRCTRPAPISKLGPGRST